VRRSPRVVEEAVFVSEWSDGYVADIEYTFGYYGELNPLRVAVPFFNVGLTPPTVRTACELGYGQGIAVNIHAAASDISWYGTDFHPAHAAFAQSLADTAHSGAQLFDESFAEFCGRPDLPDFDFVALHGIYSWISDENQRTIVDFLRRKLKVGGVLYISYNTQPGFATVGPLQHLLARHAATMAAPGHGLLARVDGALDFIDRLVALNPGFVAANPGLIDRLRQIKGQNRHYVAHEFFNEYWRPIPFADMARQLAPAKLSFACSAHYLDHIDALNLTPEQRAFVTEIPDPVFRQTVRDFMVAQQFRRDYWVKGGRRMTPLEQTEAIRRTRIMLAGRRGEIALKAQGALGQRDMAPNVYDPLLDALADGEPRTIGELEQALSSTGMRLATLYEAIVVLVGKLDAVAVQDDEVQARAKPHADRLNLALIEKARSGGDLIFLASPATGGGVGVGRFQQLFLLGLRQGQKTANELGRFVWDILAAQGQLVVKDNKPLETPDENLAELSAQSLDFLDKGLPVLQRLQIAGPSSGSGRGHA
jgi:SAM-dependent methyltransferase